MTPVSGQGDFNAENTITHNMITEPKFIIFELVSVIPAL